MLHVLYIARYRNVAMEYKIERLAARTDLKVWLVRPSVWQDEYGRIPFPPRPNQQYVTIAVPLVGKHNDPHRALYRTLTFGLRAFRPDIIHAEEEPDSLAALQILFARQTFAPRARILLHTWQNVNRAKRWVVWQILQANLRRVNAMLCANHAAVDVLRQLGYNGPAAVIPPQGVDTSVFHPLDAQASPMSFTIVFAGRFVPEKGLDVLLQALRQVGPPARLLLIGEGTCRSDLQAQVHQLGLADRVTFVPPMPPDQLAVQFNQANALVLPSRSKSVWKEQFGRVLTEAMACRVPVIGSDSGAIPDVIGSAGLVFPEGDAAALADCIRQLIESPGLRHDLAERGYARVMHLYTQERIAEQTADFYRQMMARPF